MELLALLKALGFSLPSPAFFFGAVVFGLTGYTAYQWGTIAARETLKWIGAALMLLPLLCSTTWQLYAFGAIFCVLLATSRPAADAGAELAATEDGD